MTCLTRSRRLPQVRSWPKLALGAFFATVTSYVLFADVIGDAPVNTGHVLALAALVAAIAAGHYAWPALLSGQIIPAVMLAVLFVGSTAYVVVSSGARNAETSGTKSARITENNAARARELKQLARAEGMLNEAEQKLDRDCVKGKASKGTCDGIRATLAVYSAAIKGHKATLRELGPELAPGGGYAHAAKVLVAAGIPGTAASIEERLTLLMPFAVVLVAELGTIAFLHLGLGHGRARPAPVQTPQEPRQRPVAPRRVSTPPREPTPPQPPRGRRVYRKDQALADVIEFRRPVPQAELAHRWGVGKSMVTHWLQERERAGVVHRQRQGRTATVQSTAGAGLRAVA